MEMTVSSGRVVFGPTTTLGSDRSKVSKTAVEVTQATHSRQVTYIIGQDTLFIEPHACFHLNIVTNNRLIDHHVTLNMNIIPDVGMFQFYIVTC